MPLNKLQENILEGTFVFYFSSIKECRPDIAIYALKAILDEDTYQNPKINSELQAADILCVVDFFRRILNHPNPQNRSESSPYVGQEPGQVMYAIREGDVQIRDEKHDQIILKNGYVITKAMLISDKTKYPEYRNPPPDMLTVIAKEPEGLLGLTAKGPVTKDELVQYLQLRCKCEEKNIDEKFTDTFNKIEIVYKALVDGMTCCENKAAILEALTALMKKNVLSITIAKVKITRLIEL